ncbi:MAG: hypothetical protein ACP5MW_06485, partial [Thermoplasmata archaeon]
LIIIIWELFISAGLAIDLVASINLLTTSVSKDIVSSSTGINMIARTAGGVVGGTISGYILTSYIYYYHFNINAIPLLLPDNHAYFLAFFVSSMVSLLILLISLFSRK